MPGPLSGLCIHEPAWFVTGAICGLHFAQPGVDVVGIDTVEGSQEQVRWPLSLEGQTCFRDGLNKPKKSTAFDLTTRKGRSFRPETGKLGRITQRSRATYSKARAPVPDLRAAPPGTRPSRRIGDDIADALMLLGLASSELRYERNLS